MSTRGKKEKGLQNWINRVNKHSEAVDKMLLEQSRRHRALQKRTRITRFVVNK